MTQYDEGVEQLFTFVQVFTASMNSFAHGANDIANAIAPVAGIVAIYQTGELSSKSPVPKVIKTSVDYKIFQLPVQSLSLSIPDLLKSGFWRMEVLV